ncbi:MAG: hypothetical protein HQL03_10805 [Nitrospirae bacterium]|nr:hypothetical protein [Nitrospirota bacterium]
MVTSFLFRGFRALVVVLTFLSTFLLNGQVYAIEDAGLIPLASEANILKGSGQRGYAVCGKSVFVVDPRTRAILKQIDFQHMVNDIAIDDASNTLIVIEDKDKSWDIHFIHLQTWDRYAVVDKINDPVSVVIDSQRNLVVVASQSDSRLTLLGLGSQGIVGQIGLDARPSAMSYYAGGGILLVTESNDAGQGNGAGKSNFLQVVDVNGKRSLLTLTTDDEIATASVDEATARAAIGLRKGAISILDLSNLQQRSLTSLNTKLNDVELYGRSLIASDNSAGYIVNLNPDTGQVKERLTIGNKTNLIARTSGYYLISYKDGIRVIKGSSAEITAITPQKVMVASTGVQLQVTGINFAQGSVVKVDGVSLSTTFVSETTLTADLTDTFTTKAATHSVTVTSAEGVESNVVSLSVENPVPQISSLVPIETNANTGAMVLEVLGSSFVGDTSVNFNGSLRQTAYVSGMKVTVNLLLSDTATAGTYQVYAVNPAPGGGSSNTFQFTVKNPIPAITGVTPSEAAIGSGDVALTIAGSGFVSASDVYFGTTVVSKTALTANSITATVPGTLLQTAGQYPVKVKNPTPGGGDSSPYTFSVVTELSIAITEPADGATVDRMMALVRGTFSWESGDVGIVVNGVPAEVSGRQWYANNVMLVVGANTITATITNTSGNSKSTYITVNTTTTDQAVTLGTNIASGLAPLTTNFYVLKDLPNEVTGYAIDFEGDGSIDYTATEFDSVKYTYTTPGMYYPTITLTDSAGNTYTDRIAVTVLDKAETDAMLRAKWDSMKAAFASGDIEGGLLYICSESRNDYRNAFQFLGDRVPVIFSSMQEISLIYVRNGVAKYRIRQDEDIEGSSVEITYYIYFG